jgi:hypothetical protein
LGASLARPWGSAGAMRAKAITTGAAIMLGALAGPANVLDV